MINDIIIAGYPYSGGATAQLAFCVPVVSGQTLNFRINGTGSFEGMVISDQLWG